MMFRKIGFLAILMSLALPAWSATSVGKISGYVRDSSGVPQMGATVEVLGSAAQNLKVFTDAHGFFSIVDLLPGTYSLKVSAPSFLPTLRERIGLHSGAKLMVIDLTLSTLERVDFRDADMRAAVLKQAFLAQADMTAVKLDAVVLDGNLNQCRRSNLDQARLWGTKLCNASLRGASLLNSDFQRADLTGADLRDARLAGASFNAAKVEGALFEGADMRHVYGLTLPQPAAADAD
jgi:hypothetical protein